MTIEEALVAVRAAVDSVPEDERAAGSESIEYVLRTADEARARYEAADPVLITPTMSSRLNEVLVGLGTEIREQIGAADGVNWDVVRRAADVVLDALYLLPPARSSDVEVATSRGQIERLVVRSQELDKQLEASGRADRE